MPDPPLDDGMRVIDDATVTSDDAAEADRRDGGEGDGPGGAYGDGSLESLRDAFVDGFNARDLDAILELVHADVDCPDIAGDGQGALGEELQAIWERSPGAILTRAFVDREACAIGWLPDEDGCWVRAALVCFDAEDGLLTLVTMPEDADALDRAEAEDPSGEELDEWSDWSEWDRGEETMPGPRP